MEMLRVEGLSLRRGDKYLLSDISLTLKQQELVAILGPNGAGKSTLFKSICGEYQPDSGRVYLKDKALNHWPLFEKAKTLAVLPQVSSLNFPFTVNEVVAMGRYPHSTCQQENQRVVDEMLNTVGVFHLKDAHYTTLSGGEKQRVHFARIMAQLFEEQSVNEKLLMLDEPTSALDPAYQQQILKIAKGMTDCKTSIFVILHDLNLAARYADRIILLKAGKKVADGKPEEVLTEAILADVFSIQTKIMPHPDSGFPVVIVN